MYVGAPFPFLLLVAVVIVIIVIATSAGGTRRRQFHWPHQRVCDGCRTAHPLHANYCRRCGRKLV